MLALSVCIAVNGYVCWRLRRRLVEVEWRTYELGLDVETRRLQELAYDRERAGRSLYQVAFDAVRNPR
jgi:hypothetical protein